VAPNIPYFVKARPLPDDVGGGQGRDLAAHVAGSISTAIGLFDTDTPSISESSPGGANDFALQLNSNLFDTDSCTPPQPTPPTPPIPKSPDCKGWQQFIFSNFNHGAFIQYWLIRYFRNRPACSPDVDVEHGGCCPSDWSAAKVADPDVAGCYRNSAMTSPATPLVTLTAEALVDLNLLGRVTTDSDTVSVATDTQNIYTGNGLGNILKLAGNWKTAEFNIVGDGNFGKASFPDGSTTIDVRIDVGGDATCSEKADGITGETNNLNIVPTKSGSLCCGWTAGPGNGGIMFTESNVAGARSACDAGKQCLPVGSSCSITGTQCCATFGEAACQHGVCAPRTSPPICNVNGVDVPRPTQSCNPHAGWHCCGIDGWVCGQCQN
jgi:hypothetical protein